MNRERLSAVVLSVLLVASAATAVVPASAFVSTADATTAGDAVGNDSTATPSDSTTTATTATANTTITTTSATTADDSTARDATTATDPKSKATPPRPDEKSDPKVASSLLDRIEPSGPTADGVESSDFVQVVVRAGPGRSDEAAGLVGANGGDVQARHDRLVQARVPAAAVRALASSPAVEFVREPYRPDTNEITSEGLSNMDAGNVHDAGYTGDDVTVAVVDVGFDVTNPEIADQVVDFRNFSSPDSPRTMSNESGEHGTATAELVADTAPDASIIAVTVGTEIELYEAIDWLESETDADVVTMSMSWYNAGPLDGTAYMNRQINASIQRGTTWLTSAGNDGDRKHWNGTWSDPENTGWLNFSGIDETMTVTPAGGSGTLYIELSWNDWGGSYEDYDAYLVNGNGEFVAGSTNVQDGTQPPTERIYYYADEEVHLAIWNRSANGTADFDVFFRGNADPEYATRARSVTLPGTGPNIITVGAADYRDDTLESFSSRGPTIDGRIKPDVVAPDGVTTSEYPDGFYGTSAATPHTAGVAALMLDANEGLAPAEVGSRLTESADPLRGTEPNPETGYGRVNADAAIPPEISSFEVSKYSGSSTVEIKFLSNEPLATLELTLTDDRGNTVATFTEQDTSQDSIQDGYKYQVAFGVENDGRYRATLTHASDEAGSDADPAGETTDATVVDTTPPTISVDSLADYGGNAAVSDGDRVTVTATVTDALSAVETVVADGSAFGAGTVELTPGGDGAYGGEFVVDASASPDGSYQIPMTATDAEGNERTTAGRELVLDTNAPNTTYSLDGTSESGWYTSEVDVTLAASDGTSSVARTEYRVDGGDWTTYGGDFPVTPDGRHTVEYRSVDEAGNEESAASVTFDVDATAPTTEFSTDASESESGWYDSDVTVTLDAADPTSGADAIYYRADDAGTWTEYDPDAGVQFTTDGNHDVEFYAVDDAGNEATRRTETVKIDTRKPTLADPPVLDRTEGVPPEGAIRVVSNASDDGSGVAAVVVDGVPVGRDGAGDVPAAPSLGDHAFEVVVTDAAGNEFVVSNESTAYSVGETVAMSRDNGTFAAETDDANVGEVAIETNDWTGEADVTVGTSKRNPEPDRGDPDGTALYFPQIDASIPNDDIETATVTVAVERSRVRQKYVEPDSVEFWVERENEATGWEAVDARRVGGSDDDGIYTYEIAAPHFSTYAITGEPESTPPTVAAFGPASDSPAPGEVTVAAEYGDDYSGVDPANVTLTLDGEDVTADAEVTASGLTYTANLNAGDYDADLTLVDNAGNQNRNATSFTVAAEADDGGGDGSGDGGSGGGGGGGNVPPPPVQISIEERSDGGFRAEMVSARAGSPGVVSPEGGIAAGDVTLRQLAVTPESADPEPRFFVTARVGTETPDGANALDAATLGYLHLSPTYISESEIAGVTVRFAVPASAVGAAENVAAYRLDGGEWSRVETAVVGERDDRHVLEATASGTGTFAVGVREAEGSGTDASAGTTETEPDETTAAATDEEGGRTTGGGGDGGVPGFGVGTALAALSAGLLAARRRT